MSEFSERLGEVSQPSERQKKSLFKRTEHERPGEGGGDLTITKETKESSTRKPRRVTRQEHQIFDQLDSETVKSLEEGLEELRDSRERYLLKQSQRKDLLPSGRERARQQLEALRQKRAREKPTSG